MSAQGLEFTDENIQKLFGFEDAESESIDRLREYYFKNETFKRVSSDLPIRVLVGHKGIGKSALFKVSMAEDEEKGNLPILIKPDDIAEIGMKDENFLLRIRQWKYGLTKIIGTKVFNEFGITDNKVIQKLSNFSLKLINHVTESVTVAKENLDLSPSKKLLMENYLKSKKIIVYIDDLDRGWEGKKDDISRLSALLNSVRDLASDNPGLSFKISLRSDVYFLVRTSDESTDKIEGNIVWYSWDNHEILIMLIIRILTFFDKQYTESNLRQTPQNHLGFYLDDIMEAKFQGYGKWENKPMYRILMSLIRKRPRDLVKLCTLAAREAFKDNSRVIKTEHFKNIFEEYSQGRIQDTINEYRTELPLIEKLIFGMKPTKKTNSSFADSFVFSTSELRQKLTNILQQNRFVFANGKIATAPDLAHFLYKINFLTARKVLADGEIDRKYFEENRYLTSSTADFGYDWEIHPAYRWALQPYTIEDIFNKLTLSSDI